jgi:hypothetical protein
MPYSRHKMVGINKTARSFGLPLVFLQITIAFGGCAHRAVRNGNSDPPSDLSSRNTPPSKDAVAPLIGGRSLSTEKTVARESFFVSPADYRDFSFSVSERGLLEGKFSIDNGESARFNLLVLDDLNLEKLRHGGRIACYYESGPLSSGTLSVELSRQTYHLVFVNNEPVGPRISIGADVKLINR